jgi:hypothetical protein
MVEAAPKRTNHVGRSKTFGANILSRGIVGRRGVFRGIASGRIASSRIASRDVVVRNVVVLFIRAA